MHIVVWLIAMVCSLGFGVEISENFDTLTSMMSSSAGGFAAAIALILVAADTLFFWGGVMGLRRKKYARIFLWISFGLFIAAYALDPNGKVFIGDDKSGLRPDDVLFGAFCVLVDVVLAHIDAYRQKIKQLQASKAQEA